MVLRSLVVLALLAFPASAFGEQLSELEIPTRDGATIHVEIARPDGDAKVPVILTYSPYNTIAPATPVTNLASGSPWVEQGYARAYADVIGTRNSTGCWDYGGPKEQRSGVDLVGALAKQPWSNGRVGVTGVSYDGTTANMIAAAGDVPGLAAVVPIAAISRWYGYAYQDGVRYLGNSENPTDEGFDTPLGFDFGFGRTPPDRPAAITALLDRINPCDAVDHTQHAYSTTPDYDAFWLARDYRKDAARFRVPTFVVHGWQDYNVKQSEGVDLYDDIPVDNPATAAVEGVPFKMLHLHQAPHSDGAGDDYDKRLEQFFAKTLKGVENGIEYQDAVRTQGRDGGRAGDFTRAPTFPPPGTYEERLSLAALGEPGATSSFTDAGVSTEEAALNAYPNVLPGQVVYAGKPLEKDVRLAGTPRLEVTVSSGATGGQLSPTLLDIAPDGSAVAITRGHLNLRYRRGLDRRIDMPGAGFDKATVTFAPQDQTVDKGHRIGLVLAASNTVWALPDTARNSYVIDNRASTLVLPLVGPVPAAPAPAAAPTPAPPRPAPAKLTVHVRRTRSARVLKVTGHAPVQSLLQVRIMQGKRRLARRVLILHARTGRYAVHLKLPRRARGKVRANVTATLVGGRKLRRQSPLIALRRP